MMEKYIVTKDADMLAPNWLADRIDYKSVKFLYGIHDGAVILKKRTLQNKAPNVLNDF